MCFIPWEKRRATPKSDLRGDYERPARGLRGDRIWRREISIYRTEMQIHFQCGGAWPFLVDGVLCLVHPVSDRVFKLLNRVKYDSSLISFSAPWHVNSFFLRKTFISSNHSFYAVTVFILFFCGCAVAVSKCQNNLVMQLRFFLPELILHEYSVEG